MPANSLSRRWLREHLEAALLRLEALDPPPMVAAERANRLRSHYPGMTPEQVRREVLADPMNRHDHNEARL